MIIPFEFLSKGVPSSVQIYPSSNFALLRIDNGDEEDVFINAHDKDNNLSLRIPATGTVYFWRTFEDDAWITILNNYNAPQKTFYVHKPNNLLLIKKVSEGYFSVTYMFYTTKYKL